MKIQQRITIIYVRVFISFFCVIAFIVGGIAYISSSQQANKLVETASLTKAEYLRSYLISQKEIGVALAATGTLHELLKTSITSPEYVALKMETDETLNRTIKYDSRINELFIIDANAIIIASSNNKRIHQNVSQDDFFIEGKKGPFMRGVYLSPITSTLVWGISIPVVDDNTGAVLGVVAMRLETAPLYQLIQSQSNLGSSAEVFVVDSNYLLLSPALHLNLDQILKKKIETQNVKDCFIPTLSNSDKKDNAKIYTDYRNVLILGTHSYIPEANWCLITKIDALEIYTPLLWLMGAILIAALLGAYLFYFVSDSVSRKITGPIEILYKKMQEIQGKNIFRAKDDISTDEITSLSRQFYSLISSVNMTQAVLDQKVKDQLSEIYYKTKDLQDQKKAILNILEDVEKEKSKSDQLAGDLKKFKLAVENANDHIMITDSEGKVLFVNKSAERITGFSIEEILGKKAGGKELWGGLMPREFYMNLWKTIKIDKLSFYGEVHNRRKNGVEYIAKASISPVLNEKNEVDYFVGIERDITKEVQVDKMKTEFISLASHQLRTPLSAMRWFTEMLLNGDMGKMAPEQVEAIQNIDASNKRMILLVNSLLNISRIESGRIIVDPRPTDIHLIIQDVVKELEQKYNEKKQKIILTIHSELPLISLDEKLIHEVYVNLLTNAIKYSPENTEIIISISKKDDNLISQVSDNGYGIPTTQHDKVFQKFFRANNVVKRETDGTGLGLYLVKSIIESSQGKIWFKSEENKGTSFWFTLPLSGMKEKKGEVSLN